MACRQSNDTTTQAKTFAKTQKHDNLMTWKQSAKYPIIWDLYINLKT